jgi:hypothetical protein
VATRSPRATNEAAEVAYREAIEVAGRQGSPVLKRLAALSLAKFLSGRGRGVEAYAFSFAGARRLFADAAVFRPSPKRRRCSRRSQRATIPDQAPSSPVRRSPLATKRSVDESGSRSTGDAWPNLRPLTARDWGVKGPAHNTMKT